jgi:glycerol-3-phosphate dehydrogenase
MTDIMAEAKQGADGEAQVQICDLLVIGGGINGVGIAADAAGRGLSVLLCEKSDLASATSSASSKLIHGGLRYLETWQFRLVRESLAEREVMLRAAPHIVSPMRFRLPHHKALRPVWMIRAGLFLYDHLSKRVSLPASRALRFSATDGLNPQFNRGFEYSDCWVDDARLVVLNAMQARNHGATILTRTQCVRLEPAMQGNEPLWNAELRNCITGQLTKVCARCVVNATGPWVSTVARTLYPLSPGEQVRLVKGSHIVVPRIHERDEAYLLQNADGRVVFIIPYQQQYSLIGTTEQDYEGDPALASISDEETDYLLSVATQYFSKPLQRSDIQYHFSGVRPLMDDGTENASKASRDYSLALQNLPAPLLTVYGGKITTYRKLAEAAMHKLRQIFPQMKSAWTATAALPGGDFADTAQLQQQIAQQYPWLDQTLILAWVHRYGTLIHTLLADAAKREDLGRWIGPGLYEIEVRYLYRYEWARTSDDILWRRTKLGLEFTASERALLEEILAAINTSAG